MHYNNKATLRISYRIFVLISWNITDNYFVVAKLA
jgi:hypothetical protein